MAAVQKKSEKCVYCGFQQKLISHNYSTSLQDHVQEKDLLRIILSDAGNAISEVVAFYTERGGKNEHFTWENVDRIQETFTRSPRKSMRQATVQLHMPHTTIWNVLRNHFL
ncbi:hypothetical protein AVEN_96359-1 [Araneus ventricosus]|uniref:Uncharacterized protein n=1 Tax=Araneus ventricosus TaxID=182803 RepID=A0A4Y2VPF8_ARAVE|nr:hypothetical protein AVEN_96359-1 [Araneus ventricosus]